MKNLEKSDIKEISTMCGDIMSDLLVYVEEYVEEHGVAGETDLATLIGGGDHDCAHMCAEDLSKLLKNNLHIYDLDSYLDETLTTLNMIYEDGIYVSKISVESLIEFLDDFDEDNDLQSKYFKDAVDDFDKKNADFLKKFNS